MTTLRTCVPRISKDIIELLICTGNIEVDPLKREAAELDVAGGLIAFLSAAERASHVGRPRDVSIADLDVRLFSELKTSPNLRIRAKESEIRSAIRRLLAPFALLPLRESSTSVQH